MTIEMPGVDPDRMVVLSLKPRFAEAILAGVKTVEVRRTEPKIVIPTRALLYAASPVRALLGTCIITSVRSTDLAALWREYGSDAALSHEVFLRYFEGVDVGTAMTLTEPRRFSRRVHCKPCGRSQRVSVPRRASPTSTPRPATDSHAWPPRPCNAFTERSAREASTLTMTGV